MVSFPSALTGIPKHVMDAPVMGNEITEQAEHELYIYARGDHHWRLETARLSEQRGRCLSSESPP